MRFESYAMTIIKERGVSLFAWQVLIRGSMSLFELLYTRERIRWILIVDIIFDNFIYIMHTFYRIILFLYTLSPSCISKFILFERALCDAQCANQASLTTLPEVSSRRSHSGYNVAR